MFSKSKMKQSLDHYMETGIIDYTDYRTKRKTWGDYFKNLKNPTESTKAFFLKVKVMSGIEGIPDEEFLQMDECTHSKKEPPMEYVQ